MTPTPTPVLTPRRRSRGTRNYAPPPTDVPTDDRPRYAHQRLTEEFNGSMGVTFRTYASGYVVAFGRTRDRDPASEAVVTPTNATTADAQPNERDWIAVVWTAHPLLAPRRAHLVRYLIDQSDYASALAAVDAWELEGDK